MSSLKPTLTDENKVSRMELALSFIDKNNTSKFKHMEDLIHINEKWFYLTKDGQCSIIAADEAEPYRHVQHKSFLTKIMFLCAVARPRYNMNKNAWFDGKIGIWPIRKWEPVKWSSKEVCKGNTCVEESKYNAGCLLGIFDPKAPTSHKTEMANEQWKNPVATRWRKITHSR